MRRKPYFTDDDLKALFGLTTIERSQRDRIEAIAADIASDITSQLYQRGETVASLSRGRVLSALEDAAARAIAEWIDQAG